MSLSSEAKQSLVLFVCLFEMFACLFVCFVLLREYGGGKLEGVLVNSVFVYALTSHSISVRLLCLPV